MNDASRERGGRPPKLKILHATTGLAKGGGAEANIYLSIRDLKEEFDIHLAVGADVLHNPFKGMSGITFLTCPYLVRPIRPLQDLKALYYFFRLIKKERYDIVHTHETKASLIVRIAARWAGCPYVIYGLHGVTYNDPLSRLRRAFYIWIERLTVGCADFVVSVSQSVIDDYHANKIGRDIPYRVVYSGIEIAEFEKRAVRTPQARSELRRSLGFRDDDIVLVNVGRFSHSKAQRYTIEALSRLIKTGKKAKLLLVGEGKLKEDCIRQAKDAGIADHVVFHGFSEKIPELLSIADICVLTSLREGLPRVVVESYLCKTPAVAFEVNGIREIIPDESVGYVVPQLDMDALVKNIAALMDDAARRRSMGEKGHERVARIWDHRKMIAALRDIYNTPPSGAKTTDVKNFFQAYASGFDSIYDQHTRRNPIGLMFDGILRRSMFLRYREVLNNTASSKIGTVLDIGCGPGRYCVSMAQQGKQVVGLDIAGEMLNIAKKLTAEAGATKSVSYIEGDYLQHRFDRKFDAACLIGFFDYVEKPIEVFEKLKGEISKEIYASFPRKSGFLAFQRKIRYRLRHCPLFLYSEDDIRGLLKAADLDRDYELKDLGRDYFVKIVLDRGHG